jgi:hypothetical protein
MLVSYRSAKVIIIANSIADILDLGCAPKEEQTDESFSLVLLGLHRFGTTFRTQGCHSAVS